MDFSLNTLLLSTVSSVNNIGIIYFVRAQANRTQYKRVVMTLTKPGDKTDVKLPKAVIIQNPERKRLKSTRKNTHPGRYEKGRDAHGNKSKEWF